MVSPLERFGVLLRDVRARHGATLHDALARRLDAAERATPGVACEVQSFATALLDLLEAAPDATAELARLHIEDLYFAWALAQHERVAYARLEREFMGQLAVQVGAGRELPRGELEQQVRTRLLLAEGTNPPRIRQYSGRGPFGAWLRMVAKRVSLDLLRARGGASKERALDSPGVATDPELDYLKLRYADDFKQALEQALGKLDSRQVTLLKLSYLEQLSPQVVGVMYGVSARTVQRWLVDVKDEVLAETRRALGSRLSLGPSELDSLLGLMQSRMQLSLQRVLGLADPSPR